MSKSDFKFSDPSDHLIFVTSKEILFEFFVFMKTINYLALYGAFSPNTNSVVTGKTGYRNR